MGKVRKHNPQVKLVMGLIYKDEAIFIKTKDKLKRRFGRIDFLSDPINFNYTNYYENEMGSGLKRRFVSFTKLIHIQDLYRVKLYTNRLENHGLPSDRQSHRLESRFLSVSGRKINIDPGYMDLAKLVLASTKDYAHRIYLRKGIFAEITLSYRGNSFSPNEWSYPDYRSQVYIDIFNRIRKLYVP